MNRWLDRVEYLVGSNATAFLLGGLVGSFVGIAVLAALLIVSFHHG